MSTVFVEFSDDTESVITSVFGCHQDESIFPYQGEIPVTDERYVAYVHALPAAAQLGMVTA